MEHVEVAVVGAGVVGLAVAAELAKRSSGVFIIERHPSFGQETSSRNSEVIHAGIYYPPDSLKARTCVEGNRLTYDFCRSHAIPHKKTGKLIIAIDASEVRDLEELFANGRRNGVEDLRLLSRDELKRLEPRVEAAAAIYSPSTGILDSHAMMKELVSQCAAGSAQIAYDTELTGVEKSENGFILTVKDKTGEAFTFFTRVFINAAGLNSDTVAAMAGLAKDEYRLKYCKGDYFRVHNNKARYLSRLVYPVPGKGGGGLGVHATLDLAGGLKLGPDDEYVKRIEYTVDGAKRKRYYESVKRFLPFIDLEDLAPDTSGIRPKLQGPGEPFRDFVIQEEGARGLPGLINLIGIESPGLTAAPSIAKLVSGLIK